jgi:chromosome partitioning protein
MRIIAIVNHKGGVGKTTTTLNLGKALSLQGKKVLLIDLDPQANLSQSIGIDEAEKTITDVLSNEIDLPIMKITDNLSIIPSDLSLSVTEVQLQAEQITGYFKLSNALEKVKDSYDFILIDCPPSLGILTTNALLASTEIIIIIEPQYLAIKGLGAILQLHDKLRQRLNPTLQITGMLFTQFNRTVVSRNIVEQTISKYSNMPFQTIIRQSVKISEASSMKKDIFDYDIESTGAEDYMSLAKEILNR